MKKIISILIPIIIAVFVTIAVNSFLDSKIQVLVKEKDISTMGKKCFDTVKDKSSLDKKLLSDNGDLFLLGSSELGIDVPQNSLKLFPAKGAEYNSSCFGRPFSQNLQQAIYLAGGDINDNQKVAYMLSIQWFESKNGVEAYNFAVNFSEVQFYNFLKNPKISEENKRYYAERVHNLLKEARKYPAEDYYAKLYLGSGIFSNIQKIVFKPYYEIKQYLLAVQDKALIYEKLKVLPNRKDGQTLRDINWDDEYKKIEEENKQIQCTNDFNMDDKVYNQNLKNELGGRKGESKNEDLMGSKEMDDYKFFLSVCKDLNIKPYIVVQPVNGAFYDFAELTKGQRDQWNKQAKKMAEDSGFDVLDLQSYEYKKYFFYDSKHLGREGWLRVSEGIYKHFNK